MQYTHEDSSIAYFQPTYDEVNDRVIMRSENLDYTKTFSATLGLPLKISGWWRTQNNLIYSVVVLGVYDQHQRKKSLNRTKKDTRTCQNQ